MRVGSTAVWDKEEGSFPEEHQLELAKDVGQESGARLWRESADGSGSPTRRLPGVCTSLSSQTARPGNSQPH